MNKEKYRVLVKKPQEETWQHIGKDFIEKEQAVYCKSWLSTVSNEFDYKIVIVEEIIKDL